MSAKPAIYIQVIREHLLPRWRDPSDQLEQAPAFISNDWKEGFKAGMRMAAIELDGLCQVAEFADEDEKEKQ